MFCNIMNPQPIIFGKSNSYTLPPWFSTRVHLPMSPLQNSFIFEDSLITFIWRTFNKNGWKKAEENWQRFVSDVIHSFYSSKAHVRCQRGGSLNVPNLLSWLSLMSIFLSPKEDGRNVVVVFKRTKKEIET